MNKRILHLLIAIISILSLQAQIKIACIGDNNTLGTGITSYPEILKGKLGSNYEVKNFGVKNAEYLKTADSSFWTHPKLNEVYAYQPHAVIVMLGTYDAASTWKRYDAWNLMEKLRFMPGSPHVFICTVPPAFTNSLGIDGSLISSKINPELQNVIVKNEVHEIDIYATFEKKSDLFTDGVHLSDAGLDTLANTILNKIKDIDLKRRISIAVIGNSITEGLGIDLEHKYPNELGKLLGADYVIHNFG